MPAKDSEGKEREEGRGWVSSRWENRGDGGGGGGGGGDDDFSLSFFRVVFFFGGGESVRARSVFWRVVEYRVERPPPIGKEGELVYHPGYDTNGGDIYSEYIYPLMYQPESS